MGEFSLIDLGTKSHHALQKLFLGPATCESIEDNGLELRDCHENAAVCDGAQFGATRPLTVTGDIGARSLHGFGLCGKSSLEAETNMNSIRTCELCDNRPFDVHRFAHTHTPHSALTKRFLHVVAQTL